MQKSIGDFRNLANFKEPLEIVEIIYNPNFAITWEWSKGKCNHCGKEIKENRRHIFKFVEILIPKSKKGETLLQQRFYAVGFGEDTEGKIMFIPNGDIRRIFPQSKTFKNTGG